MKRLNRFEVLFICIVLIFLISPAFSDDSCLKKNKIFHAQAVRESLLPEFMKFGEAVIQKSKELFPGGIVGPFCLETVVSSKLNIKVFEISARIVAGTNLYIQGSPYSSLYFDEPMSTGRRIARELKDAIKKNQLDKVVS